MKLETKQAGVSVTNSSATDGILEAIVGVLNNKDLDGEIMRPGFFTASLSKKLPKGVWAHNWSQPIAKTLEARELAPGDPLLPENIRNNGAYYIKAQFNLETQRGKEAFSDVKNGLIDEFSVGFFTSKDYIDQQTGDRNLLEGEWLEWSPVLAGANEMTSVIGLKDRWSRDDLRLADHGELLLDVATSFIDRMQALWGAEGMRTKEGRVLAEAHAERLRKVMDHLGGAQAGCQEILDAAAPKQKQAGEPTQEEMEAAFERFIRTQQRLRAEGFSPH